MIRALKELDTIDITHLKELITLSHLVSNHEAGLDVKAVTSTKPTKPTKPAKQPQKTKITPAKQPKQVNPEPMKEI